MPSMCWLYSRAYCYLWKAVSNGFLDLYYSTNFVAHAGSKYIFWENVHLGINLASIDYPNLHSTFFLPLWTILLFTFPLLWTSFKLIWLGWGVRVKLLFLSCLFIALLSWRESWVLISSFGNPSQFHLEILSKISN